MKTQLDVSEDEIRVLKECDLTTSVKINKCVKAANSLLKSIDSASVPPGLMKMKAFEEQKRYLENLKQVFSTTSTTYIKNSIASSFNQHSNLYKEIENKLPSHKGIYDQLIMFKDLVPWLHKSSVNKFFDEVKTVRYALFTQQFDYSLNHSPQGVHNNMQANLCQRNYTVLYVCSDDYSKSRED